MTAELTWPLAFVFPKSLFLGQPVICRDQNPGIFGFGYSSFQTFEDVQGGGASFASTYPNLPSLGHQSLFLYFRHFSVVHWRVPPCLGHRLKGIPTLGAQSHSDLQRWDPLLELWILQPFRSVPESALRT